MSRGRFFRRQIFRSSSQCTGIRLHFFLPACLLLGVGAGCSSAKVEPTLPPVPPSYTAVPHPDGTDLGDLAAVFRSSGAPIYQEFAKSCDSDFKQLRGATVSDQEIADGTRELVKRDPVHYHWCFYSKLMALHDQVKTSDYLEEKQKEVLDTYEFIVPVSRAFAREFRDSRYLRYSTLQYKKMSEWVFYRKLDLTPAGTEELVEIANPFGLWRDPFAGTPILDKYHIGENHSAAQVSSANGIKAEKPFTGSTAKASTPVSVSSVVATPPTAPGLDPADIPFEGIGGTPEVSTNAAVSVPAPVAVSSPATVAANTPATVAVSAPARVTASAPASAPVKQPVNVVAASAPASPDDIPFDTPAAAAPGPVAATTSATVAAKAPVSIPAKQSVNAAAASAPASPDDIPFDTPAPAPPAPVASVQAPAVKPDGTSSVSQKPAGDAAVPSAVVPVQKIAMPSQLDDNGTGGQTDVISSEPAPKKAPQVASAPPQGSPSVAAASGPLAVPTGLEGIPAEVLASLAPASVSTPAPAPKSAPKPAPAAAAVAKAAPVSTKPLVPVKAVPQVTPKPQVAKAVVPKKAAAVPKPAATFNPDTDIPLN